MLRWQTTSARGAQLIVAIQYSFDNGRRWRGIYLGPNRGRVLLPSTYFSMSRRARIRIVVNDGFNQTQAVSRPFSAVGSPPVVTLLDPSAGQTFSGDSLLLLHGQAFDDTLTPLRGRSLRWMAGGALLGTGATIMASRLPPGNDRITLLASDSHGRTASASVVIHVKAVKLPFLRLSVPHRVGPGAQRLTVRASSALPTTLTVGRKHYKLGRAPRTITLPIARGRGSLTVQLSVTARGVTYPITVVVRR
jgi:hypothetical protein